MEILELLDRLEEILTRAPRVPLTGKIWVDPDEVLALMDELREVVPEEVRTANAMHRERMQLMADARAEAEAIVRDAKQYVAQLTDETAIAKEAQARADEMIDQAKRVAKEIRQGAKEYADEMLQKTERALTQSEADLNRALQVLRKGREELQR